MIYSVWMSTSVSPTRAARAPGASTRSAATPANVPPEEPEIRTARPDAQLPDCRQEVSLVNKKDKRIRSRILEPVFI
jgi:hypothetical protein